MEIKGTRRLILDNYMIGATHRNQIIRRWHIPKKKLHTVRAIYITLTDRSQMFSHLLNKFPKILKFILNFIFEH